MSFKTELKKFYSWTKLKIRLNNLRRTQNVKEGELWWAAVGKNIGIEINGKHENFARPVIVFRKLGYKGFLAIPTTTQLHEGTWYVPITVRDKVTRVVLSQVKIMSTSRLYKKIGILSKNDMTRVREGFEKLYLGKK